MTKKVAIFTLQGLVNYGNRLQNYAVEYLLKSKGCKVDSIVVTGHPLLKPIKIRIMRNYKMFCGNRYERIEAKRQSLFSKFNESINIKYYNVRHLNLINEHYDISLTGSDQVWNPSFNKNNLYLLPFAKKRMCLSPSFGVGELSMQEVVSYAEELLKFDSLSVREESGAKLVYDLIGCNAEVLIDPTMALDVSIWKKIEKKPQDFAVKDFILSYTLGDLGKEREKAINIINEKHKFEHIEIFDDLKENKYIVGPREFLWLIHNAKIIITDSFHASVFSILFEKPFIAIRREGAPEAMFDRIQTLLKKFNLENCSLEHINKENFMNVDYSHCRRRLIEERKRINDYVDKALKE